MSRKWKVVALIGVVSLIVAGAWKFVAIAGLILLMPVYALLLFSVFLLAFFLIAAVVVSLRQTVFQRESAAVDLRPPIAQDAHDMPRKAA